MVYRGKAGMFLGLVILAILMTGLPVGAQEINPGGKGTGFVLPPPDDPFWRMETVPRDHDKETFPAVFDWRMLGGVTPAKDQGGCGSCWAFATIGVAEAAIRIRDGVVVDLSEQHLLGCNSSGWGCSGALWAYQWLIDTQDKCGRIGALLESQIPYTGDDTDCNCAPQPVYRFNSWGYVNGLTPSVADIKSALMRYGPVGAGVVSSVLGSGSGVIGGCASYSFWDVDHVVVIVGWDDTKGTSGAWIIKNSWGEDWGDNGFGYIEYGCAQIGFGATYVAYGDTMTITPAVGLEAQGEAGGPFTPSQQAYTVKNDGSTSISWSVTAPSWVTLSQSGGTLAAGAQTTVTATLNAANLSPGTYAGDLVFVNAATGYEQRRRFTLTVLAPVLYAFPLDTDPGWARTGDWAFGKPTGQGSRNPDPTAGFTGNNVFGNNLSGDYPNNAPIMTLTAGPLDFSSAHSVTLEFQRWLGVEQRQYDRAALQVSPDGSTWYTLWENPDSDLSESGWSRQTFDLGARADGVATFYVRWELGPTDNSVTFSGWNIDDIMFRGITTGGGPGEPVEITSIEDLQKIGNDPAWPANGRYYLTTDLDASATATWNAGAGFSPILDFSGEFDGQGHWIRGLVINRPGTNQVGLFGTVATGGRIQRLGLENVNIRGNLLTGGLAGVNRGNLSSCVVTGMVTGSDVTGGIVGSNAGGTLADCRASVTLSGGVRVGGAVGENSGPVTRALSTGPVSGSSNVGGLAGWNGNSITASFWDLDSSGVNWSAGGTGLGTSALWQRSTYEAAGWDFNATWWIQDGAGYPIPAWAGTPDTTPPVPPAVQSSSHTVNGLSRDRVLYMAWQGAEDPESGIAGYAWTFSMDSGADPGEVIRTIHATDPHEVTSDPLADGAWYFRLRARNGAGLWSDPVTWGPVTIDATPPVVTLNGSATVTVACGSSYQEPGATAWDTREGDVSSSLVVEGSVNPAVPGVYTLTWTARDAAGNLGSAVREVRVEDAEPPVVTLNGPVEVSLNCGDGWTDPGASAVDACDGPLGVSVEGGVNTGTPGLYALRYTASDAAGHSVSVTRQVRVEDAEPPVVTLNGAAEVSLNCGDGWTDPGASAVDACDGTLPLLVTGSVNPSSAGIYPIQYTATDAAGHAVSVLRQVRVEDAEPPVITLNGDRVVTLRQYDVFTDPGAGALDACEGAVNVTVLGQVNTAAIGLYYLDYAAVDRSANQAIARRTIIVNPRTHSADTNGNGRIDMEELLRVIQLFQAGQYSIATGGASEDGYQPGPGSQDGSAHDADYAPRDWRISVEELMRVIQLYHLGGYRTCPDGEDLYCGAAR